MEKEKSNQITIEIHLMSWNKQNKFMEYIFEFFVF